MKSPTNKQICEFYFGSKPTDIEKSTWTCACGAKRKCVPELSGYTNLFSHIRDSHKDYLAVWGENIAEDGQTLVQKTLSHFIDSKSKNIYNWLQWIILDEHELQFCEKELTKKNSSLDSICKKTLKKYMLLLVSKIEKEITLKINSAPCFSLVIDSWTDSTMHFVGIFASFPGVFYDSKPQLILLAFSPLEDETNFTSNNYVEFIEEILSFYEIPLSKLIAITGDNCSTNKAMCDKLKKPLLGCRSHRFNLAVEEFLDMFLFDEIKIISEVMQKLMTQKLGGRLRMWTSLKAEKRNATRWNSAIRMISKYLKLHETVKENFDLVTLSNSQFSKVSFYFTELEKLFSVSLELQNQNTTIGESRILFNQVINEFKDYNFEKYLSLSANIVHSQIFESAIEKIQDGSEMRLSTAEKKLVQKLLKKKATPSEVQQSNNFAKNALKKAKIDKGDSSNYLNTSFLRPTSNDCERLFSLGKRIYSSKRKQLAPRTLEALVFLKANQEMWDQKTVHEIRKENSFPDQ